MRLVLCVLSVALFLSCADQNKSPGIQDIVNQWTDIEKLFADNAREAGALIEAARLLEASDEFYRSLQEFQMSDLYRIYRAISFLPQTERTFNNYTLGDIEEVGIVSQLALIFRNSIASGDMEKAGTVSPEISKCLVRLLIIDGKAQRYISSAYFNLFIAFIFFIAIIALLIRFLHYSLTRSLMRETDTIIFSHAYMLAQDEERARISRELHDTIIQDMRCLLLETEKIGNTGEKTAPMNLSQACPGQAPLLMADLIRKTRDICNSLIPPDFRSSELPDALQQLCHDFGEKTGIECRAEIDGNINLEFLSMEKRLQVFRIVQEALTNIEKHAQAKETIVTMRQTAESGQGSGAVYIGIDDDGKGFKSPLDDNGQVISSHNKSHIGIISMKERAAILGGRLKIVSEPGEGALVCLEIPSRETSNGRIINR